MLWTSKQRVRELGAWAILAGLGFPGVRALK